MLGGGEVPGRAWRRALCLNSSGPGLGSAVETVPTTTVPETMAPETMAPENTEALTPENTCKPCLQDCAESGGKCQRGSGQGARRARRYAQRRASSACFAKRSATHRKTHERLRAQGVRE